MNKTLIIGALILIAILGLMLWGRTGDAGPRDQSQSLSALIAVESSHNFGAISMKNGTVEKQFTFRNPTDALITITSVSTSCMCTTAYLLAPSGEQGPFGMPGHGGQSRSIRETLAPGETRIARVVYDPNAHGPAGVGPMQRFVYIVDNDGRQLTFEITGNVTP